MGIILLQMIVVQMMLQVTLLPRYKGRETNHGMGHFSDDAVDEIPVCFMFGNGRVSRIVSNAPHAPHGKSRRAL